MKNNWNIYSQQKTSLEVSVVQQRQLLKLLMELNMWLEAVIKSYVRIYPQNSNKINKM